MSRKRKINSLLALVVLLCIIFFFSFTNLGTGFRDITILMLTGKKINLEERFQELKDMEETKNFDIYLTGEMHGTELSFKMQEYMAKYFIEKQGVKYILLEGQISEAELLNRYLKTGDAEIIKNLINSFKGTFADNQNTYDLFEFYYKYNKQLPDDKKVSFVGIDVENSFSVTSEYLRYLIKDLGEPDEKIKNLIKRINKYRDGNDQFLFDNLRKSLKEDEEEYKEFFGEDFFYFKKVIENTFWENNTAREAIMVKNFQDFYEKLPKGKYYGQLGKSHVYKLIRTGNNGGEDPINTFANSINNDYEPTKGKVYSIIYVYMNSYYRSDGIEEPYGEINIPYFKGKGSVRLYTKDNNKKAYKIFERWGAQEGLLGDVTFILKDSKGATKLNKE